MVTVLDHSDISWDYPPRDISRGPFVAQILGEGARQAAILVPCFRGMTLKLNELSDTAEGDRSDAWAGASLDARAFLTVALHRFPSLPADIVAYGYSRGGGVALLTGERDRRIDRVAAFAAPTDFFVAMARDDPDWAEQLRERARQGNPPEDDRAYQYVDWFFTGATGEFEIRQRMLRASALYFLKRLPKSTLYQGGADRPVPPENAVAVQTWAENTGRDDIEVRIYPGAPHLLSETSAFAEARSFILPN
jgi:dipeptidyl aminopeptidase/acylaminoacyl peptidase